MKILGFSLFFSLSRALAARRGDASPPPPSTVSVYDLTYTSTLSHVDRYEHLQFVAALSGLMNRASTWLRPSCVRSRSSGSRMRSES